jgi:elongation factor P
VISTSDFKKGSRILLDGQPYTVEDFTVQTPSARGAATLVRCKLRGIVDGVLVDKTFKSGERFETPDVAFRKIQYLYDDGTACHFMDTASYEQFELANDTIEDVRPWLVEEMELQAVMWDGRCVGVNLPIHVVAEVDMVGGGSRSDTASGRNLKEATLTNGLTIKVPLFIESGEKIVVDPKTREFVRRGE